MLAWRPGPRSIDCGQNSRNDSDAMTLHLVVASIMKAGGRPRDVCEICYAFRASLGYTMGELHFPGLRHTRSVAVLQSCADR